MPKKLVLKKLTDYDSKPVTSDKIIDKKRFHEAGLYSQSIFGPIKDYVCQCGKYDPFGGECEVCKVPYTKSDVRGKKFGHIALPVEIINPLFLWNLSTRIKKSTTKIDLPSLIFYKKILIFKDGEPRMVSIEDFDTVKESYDTYYGVEAVKKVIAFIEDKIKENEKFKIEPYIKMSSWKIIKEAGEHLYIDRVLVVPPDLRPILFTGNKMIVQETLSRLYTTLLTKLNIMNNKTKFIKGVNTTTFKNYSDIQYMVSGIYEEILSIFGGKTGIIRGNMLGKRIDYSGRAVIAVDPSLKYNECRIPYYILLEVYKYSLARDISKKRNVMIFKVLDEIEESLKFKDYRFLKEVEEFVKNRMVMLNRQPTLYKLGVLGWNIKVSTDFTIKIHPFACPAYNADFDGDSVIGSVDLLIDGKKKTFEMQDLLNVELNEKTNNWELKK